MKALTWHSAWNMARPRESWLLLLSLMNSRLGLIADRKFSCKATVSARFNVSLSFLFLFLPFFSPFLKKKKILFAWSVLLQEVKLKASDSIIFELTVLTSRNPARSGKGRMDFLKQLKPRRSHHAWEAARGFSSHTAFQSWRRGLGLTHRCPGNSRAWRPPSLIP